MQDTQGDCPEYPTFILRTRAALELKSRFFSDPRLTYPCISDKHSGDGWGINILSRNNPK